MKQVESIVFWLLAAIAATFAAFVVFALTGHLVREPRQTLRFQTTAAATVAAAPARPPPAATRPVVNRKRPQRAGTRRSAASPPAVMLVDIRAADGDSWIEARVNSSAGRVLFTGLLSRGRSLHLEAKRVWLRLGAAANVEVRVNGQRRDVGAGTLDIVLVPAL